VRRDAKATRRFFERAIGTTAVVTGRGRHRPSGGIPGGVGRAVPGGLSLCRAVPPIAASRPTTADSRCDCDRCAGSGRTAAPR
jgi:hypothetical protein